MVIKLSDGSWYPHIPTICYCMRPSCYEICWKNNYKKGHYPARKDVKPWNKEKKWSQEVRDKISKSHLGKSPWNLGLTKETDLRVKRGAEATSKGRIGITTWNKNKPWEQEVKDKISESKKGKPSTFKGKKHKQESKDKMTKSWNYDKHFTEEICNKISESNKNIIHTKEWNENVGNSLRGKPISDSIGTSKGKYYNSPFQGTIWLRSSYEIKCALYLDRNNIPWIYESKAFPMKIIIDGKEKNTTYRPDFILLTNEIKFIDTKGYLHPESKLKIEEFKMKYKNLKLEIWYRKDLLKLGIKVK